MPASFLPQRAQASSNYRLGRYLFVATLFTFIFICGFVPMRAQVTSAGPVTERCTEDYDQLLAMDDTPDVAPAADTTISDKGKAPHKIADRYDVSKIGARHVDNGVNFYSIDKEVAMGKEMARQWESQAQMLKDAAINGYINTIAQRLVRNSDAKVPFTVKVVDSDEVNAFALPGGYFYVNTGLILAAQNEAELAGVMAHEIAHVAARHGTRGMTKSQLWNIASIPMMFAGGPIGFAVRQVTSLAFPMSTLKFGRDAEREADLLGLEYAYASGYDPVSFVSFFERLQTKDKKKPNFVAKAFATHPMNEDRIRRAQFEIDTMLPPHELYVVDTSEFDEMQARLLQLQGSKSASGDGPILRRHTGDQRQKDENRPELKRR